MRTADREEWKAHIEALLADAERSKREIDEWLAEWRARQRQLEPEGA